MKNTQILTLIVCLILSAISGIAAESPELTLKPGLWIGAIEIPGMGELAIVFNIDYDGQAYSATCDSPDQGVTGLPVESVTVTENQVKLTVPSVLAWFEGEIQSGGAVITGKWNQGGQALVCEVKLSDTPYSPKRPQRPEAPFPYQVKEVEFTNPDADIVLAGTLTIPEGEGPFPAVVLVAGSGPNDRDETVFGHKPFLVLSDYLTRHDIVVLRYDKRGVGESKGDYVTATSADFASDAVAALTFLREQQKVNSGKIGLIGHSEGGLIAPMVAAEKPDRVNFIVMMAGPGVSGHELLPVQLEMVLTLSGQTPEEISKSKEQQQMVFTILREEADLEKAAERLTELAKKLYAEMTDEEKAQEGVTEEAVIQGALSSNTAWLRFFLMADPRDYLRKTQCPTLAIWGEKDVQVPPEQNRPEVEKALAEAGNKNAVLKVFPGMNHLFQTAETGQVMEYGKIEETLSPDVLKEITEWIKAI